jgi:hypothetical protein
MVMPTERSQKVPIWTEVRMMLTHDRTTKRRLAKKQTGEECDAEHTAAEHWHVRGAWLKHGEHRSHERLCADNDERRVYPTKKEAPSYTPLCSFSCVYGVCAGAGAGAHERVCVCE